MTEFCFPNTSNNKLEKIKPYELTTFCAFIVSHPLYLSYVIFFSPYLLKLFSFLSPLFFTTFLLFLSLVTTLIPIKSIINSKDGFFLTTFTTLIEKFDSSFEVDDEKSVAIEEFEVYKVVFDVPIIVELSEVNPIEDEMFGENPFEKLCQLEEKTIIELSEVYPIENEIFGENTIEKLCQVEEKTIELSEVNPVENKIFGENPIEKFCQLEEKTIEESEVNPIENEIFGESPFEKLCQLEEKSIKLSKVTPIENDKFEEYPNDKFCQLGDKIVGQSESLTLKGKNLKKVEEVLLKGRGSKVNNGDNKTPKFGTLKVNNDEKLFEEQYLGSSRSMRKEKEWRRTLACKLFEERHNWSNNKINVIGEDGQEGMDLLWETNEIEINKGKLKEEKKNNKIGERRKGGNKIEDDFLNIDENRDESEEYDDYYENGKICCLQALKLSAGKMNLSMGTPNLVKISKAFKGFGWLHGHVRRHKNKVY